MVILILLLLAAVLIFCIYRTEQVFKERYRMVTEAAQQLFQAQHRAEKKHHAQKSAEVLNRSRRIYTQAAALYEQTLAQHKYQPWASLLGYGPLGEDGLPTYTAPLWRRKKRPPKQKGEPTVKSNNMKKAMFEMFGIGSEASMEVVVFEEKLNATEAMVARPTEVAAAAKKEDTVATIPAAAPVVSMRPVSYLAADTVWEGNLRSDGDVEVAGAFLGDISAKGSVILRSTVEGNVQAGTLQLNSCTLTGDAEITELAVVSADSRMEGNVNAHDLRCAGTINGNITVNGHITLEQTARISGNIITSSISVAKGAVICGGVEIKSGEN